MGQAYRIYGDLCFCGVGPMGFVGVYGIAVWHLWGTRCLIYGDLWGCMGIYGDHVSAVWDLWDSYGSMGLRCGSYGAEGV